MKKTLIVLSLMAVVLSFSFASQAEARGRYGSVRIGGYNSAGKGSHYMGGYVRYWK